ncbi:ion transporter [Cereibacter sphaeroides]|uniref:ion channel n=1 Tax=Cereibacter sphaeroides TaxID=1063 RepID=UPI001F3D916D|nr:ion channel [Cereibacter sphaeroides]MCE6958827.1 ion transporter [Cereibacter sphaeroides]MCE6973299.1 ion transporter [Cereibacter sphaeroides]
MVQVAKTEGEDPGHDKARCHCGCGATAHRAARPAATAPSDAKGWRKRLHDLYEGRSRRAHRFRYALLAFDVAVLVFIIATSFLPAMPWREAADTVVGGLILVDLLARLAAHRRPLRFLLQPMTWVDIAATASFLVPVSGEMAGFLRVLRTYPVLARLRIDWPYFRRNEEMLLALTNLCVFLFVTTGIIYTAEAGRNPEIRNYADALYFTVTTLTTTGFGDITLDGTRGRMISIVIMIFGVTLFLRLAQTLFRPNKVRFRCPDCGLVLHDWDAVHCKHCGRVLNIRSDGD